MAPILGFPSSEFARVFGMRKTGVTEVHQMVKKVSDGQNYDTVLAYMNNASR